VLKWWKIYKQNKKKSMFSIFKSDPIKKLEKKKAKLQEEAYRLSHTDRKASDLLNQQAGEIEEEIKKLLAQKK